MTSNEILLLAAFAFLMVAPNIADTIDAFLHNHFLRDN